jgi:hypothetical protein
LNKKILKDTALIVGSAAIIVCVIFVLNILFLLSNQHFTPTDATFLEGIVFAGSGALFLLGSGGIGRGTHKAVGVASAASAYGADTVGPGEIYRRDAWKPKGMKRFGLTLMLAGIILLAIYFASLNYVGVGVQQETPKGT